MPQLLRKIKSIDLIIVANLFLIIIALGLFQVTNIDLDFQEYWFNKVDQSWLIDKNEPIKKFFFYNFPKILLGIFILSSLLALLFSFLQPKFDDYDNFFANYFCSQLPFFKKQRQKFLILFLGLSLIPLVVGNIKIFTNIYCPNQLEIYGGSYPYVKILSSYPEGFLQVKKGKCFPAGHAVTGFCIMILFFIFEKKSYRVYGLILGLVLGWLMGLYQITKGAHFLSDTVLSMLFCFLVAALIFKLVTNFSKDNSCK